jgi:hypothetical protein
MSIDYSKVYDVDVFSIREQWIKKYNSFWSSFRLIPLKDLKFECPEFKCNRWIHLDWPWECHYCKQINIPKNLRNSIFGRCQCSKVPTAYQCPRAGCGFVFQLWPGSKYLTYATHADYALEPKFPVFPQPIPVVEPPKPLQEPPFIPHGIPFKERFAHTLILAAPNWGKTKLMQALMYHDLRAHSSVVVVDSQGPLLKQVLKLRDKVDLIYINFCDPENVPCLSLFDIKRGSTPEERERVLIGTLELYKYVFTSLLGSGQTPNQVAMLGFIAELMLEIKVANLNTVKNVLIDVGPYMNREVRQLRPEASSYFHRDFNTKDGREVREQVMRRVNTILAHPVLARVFTQSKTKIDLYRAINSGKTIVVNTSVNHLQQEGASILGQFFIAMLLQAALRRSGEPLTNKPTFLYIDEAWMYYDNKLPELYAMARKYDLGLVIASQYIEQFKKVSMLLIDAAFSSALFFAGRVSDKEDREVIGELGLSQKDFSTKQLQKETDAHGKPIASEFYFRSEGKSGRKVKIPFYTMESAPQLSNEEFREMLEENNERYCERMRVRGGRAQPAEVDETVLEPDEQGVLRPRGLPGADRSDEFWQ